MFLSLFSDLLATVQLSVQSVQPLGVQPGGPELIHFEIDPEIDPEINWSILELVL